MVAVGAALVLFMGFFFHAVRGRMVAQAGGAWSRAAVVIDLAIASALTIADRPDWSLLFYYVVALAASVFRARGTSWPCRSRP